MRRRTAGRRLLWGGLRRWGEEVGMYEGDPELTVDDRDADGERADSNGRCDAGEDG